MALTDLVLIATSLEGPYKWYAIGGIVFLISAILIKIALKTVKWMLLLVCLAFVVYAILHYWPAMG